jgi:hypothetical protein
MAARAQPEPDLEFCFFFNAESCCVAGHDEIIANGACQGRVMSGEGGAREGGSGGGGFLRRRVEMSLVGVAEYNELVPGQCAREFAALERYFCASCNPDVATFVNATGKELRVCQSAADALFEDDRGQYDRCGFLLGGGVLLPGVAVNASTGDRVFSTASDLFNYQAADGSHPFRPTFYKDYTVVIVPDGTLPCVTAGSVAAFFSALAQPFLFLLLSILLLLSPPLRA